MDLFLCFKVIQYIVGKFENGIHMMAKIKIMTIQGIYTQKVRSKWVWETDRGRTRQVLVSLRN